MRRPVMRRAVTGSVADTGVARVAMLPNARISSLFAATVQATGDQAAMFAPGEMQRVTFAEADVEAQTVRRYHPGAATSPEGCP